MSLLFLESFDFSRPGSASNGAILPDLAAKGWVMSTFASGSLGLVGGRTGPQALELLFTAIIGGATIARQVPPAAEHVTFTLGFALNLGKLDTFISQILSDELSTTHAKLTVGAGGQLHLYAGPGLPLVGSSATLVTTNVWNYIEMQLTLGTTGSVALQLNGAPAITVGGINTRNGGTKTTLDSIGFATTSTINTIDDIYLTNGAGSVNTGFLGDTQVLVTRPVGNGVRSDLINDLGNSIDNFSHVNSAQAQFTTFVQSPTLGAEDVYVMSSIPPAVGVSGLQTVALAAKNNPASRLLEPVIHVGATDYPGTAVALSTGAAYQQQMWESDPSTSSPWTATGVNSAEFGVRVE